MQNKMVIGLVMALFIGGVVGYFVGQRSMGGGPFASLQAVPSSASITSEAFTCEGMQAAITDIRNNDDGSRRMQKEYNAAIARYNKAGCGR